MSAQRFDLLASSAQTATANGAAFAVATITELQVSVDITAVSGTTPLDSVWLQGSDDDGTTWYDLPADLVIVDDPTDNADTTVGVNVRNIFTDRATVGRALAIYKHLPTDKIRARWVISGTTPSFTKSIRAVGK